MPLPSIKGIQESAPARTGPVQRAVPNPASLVNTKAPTGLEQIKKTFDTLSVSQREAQEKIEKEEDQKALATLTNFASDPANREAVLHAARTGDKSGLPIDRPTRPVFLAGLSKSLSIGLIPQYSEQVRQSLSSLSLNENPIDFVKNQINEITEGLQNPVLEDELRRGITDATAKYVAEELVARENHHNTTTINAFNVNLRGTVEQKGAFTGENLNQLIVSTIAQLKGSTALNAKLILPKIKEQLIRLSMNPDPDLRQRAISLMNQPLQILNNETIARTMGQSERTKVEKQIVESAEKVLSEQQEERIREMTVELSGIKVWTKEVRDDANRKVAKLMTSLNLSLFSAQGSKLLGFIAKQTLDSNAANAVFGGGPGAPTVVLTPKQIRDRTVQALQDIGSIVSNEGWTPESIAKLTDQIRGMNNVLGRADPSQTSTLQKRVSQFFTSADNPDVTVAIIAALQAASKNIKGFRPSNLLGEGEGLALFALLVHPDVNLSTTDDAAKAIADAKNKIGQIGSNSRAFSDLLDSYETSDKVSSVPSVKAVPTFFKQFSEELGEAFGIPKELFENPEMMSGEMHEYMKRVFNLTINSNSSLTFGEPINLIERSKLFNQLRPIYFIGEKAYFDKTSGFQLTADGRLVKTRTPNVTTDALNNIFTPDAGELRPTNTPGTHALHHPISGKRYAVFVGDTMQLPEGLQNVFNQGTNRNLVASDEDLEKRIGSKERLGVRFTSEGTGVDTTVSASLVDRKDIRSIDTSLSELISGFKPTFRYIENSDEWRKTPPEDRKGTYTIRDGQLYLAMPPKPTNSNRINLDLSGSTYLYYGDNNTVEIRADPARLALHPSNNDNSGILASLASFLNIGTPPAPVPGTSVSERVYQMLLNQGEAGTITDEDKLAEAAAIKISRYAVSRNNAALFEMIGNQTDFQKQYRNGTLNKSQLNLLERVAPTFLFEYKRRIMDGETGSLSKEAFTDERNSNEFLKGILNWVGNKVLGRDPSNPLIPSVPNDAPTVGTPVTDDNPVTEQSRIAEQKALVQELVQTGNVSIATANRIEGMVFDNSNKVFEAVGKEENINNSIPRRNEEAANTTQKVMTAHPLPPPGNNLTSSKTVAGVTNNNPANVPGKNGKPATFSTPTAGVEAAVTEVKNTLEKLWSDPDTSDGRVSFRDFAAAVVKSNSTWLGEPHRNAVPVPLPTSERPEPTNLKLAPFVDDLMMSGDERMTVEGSEDAGDAKMFEQGAAPLVDVPRIASALKKANPEEGKTTVRDALNGVDDLMMSGDERMTVEGSEDAGDAEMFAAQRWGVTQSKILARMKNLGKRGINKVTDNVDLLVKVARGLKPPGTLSENEDEDTFTPVGIIDSLSHMLGWNEKNAIDNNAIDKWLSAQIPRIWLKSMNPDNTAWCSAFVWSVLRTQGYTDPGNGYALVANYWLDKGDEVAANNVQAGDVVVEPRGKGLNRPGGHVMISTGKTEMRDGRLFLQVMGGNSGSNGSIKVDWRDASKLKVRRVMARGTFADQPNAKKFDGLALYTTAAAAGLPNPDTPIPSKLIEGGTSSKHRLRPSTEDWFANRLNVPSPNTPIYLGPGPEGQKNTRNLVGQIIAYHTGSDKPWKEYIDAEFNGNPLQPQTKETQSNVIGYAFQTDWPDTAKIYAEVGIKKWPSTKAMKEKITETQHAAMVGPRIKSIMEKMSEWFDGRIAELSPRQRQALMHYIYLSPWDPKNKRPLFVTRELMDAVEYRDYALVARLMRGETRVFTRNLPDSKKREIKNYTRINRGLLAAEFMSHVTWESGPVRSAELANRATNMDAAIGEA